MIINAAVRLKWMKIAACSKITTIPLFLLVYLVKWALIQLCECALRTFVRSSVEVGMQLFFFICLVQSLNHFSTLWVRARVCVCLERSVNYDGNSRLFAIALRNWHGYVFSTLDKCTTLCYSFDLYKQNVYWQVFSRTFNILGFWCASS